jgi:hypothetical protein
MQAKLSKEVEEKNLRDKVQRDKVLRKNKVEITRKIVADSRKEEVSMIIFCFD